VRDCDCGGRTWAEIGGSGARRRRARPGPGRTSPVSTSSGGLREWTQVPILILSVRDHEDDKVAALDAGADDYLTNPSTDGGARALRVMLRHSKPDDGISVVPVRGDRAGSLPKGGDQGRRAGWRSQARNTPLLSPARDPPGKVLTTGRSWRDIWGPNARSRPITCACTSTAAAQASRRTRSTETFQDRPRRRVIVLKGSDRRDPHAAPGDDTFLNPCTRTPPDAPASSLALMGARQPTGPPSHGPRLFARERLLWMRTGGSPWTPLRPLRRTSTRHGLFLIFRQGGLRGRAAAAKFDDSAWRLLDLHARLAVRGPSPPRAAEPEPRLQGRRPQVSGAQRRWYERASPSRLRPGRRIAVEFDGVFRDSVVLGSTGSIWGPPAERLHGLPLDLTTT